MIWLNAALAFAITMLIMSMVTSVFVETLHRLWGVREKGLRLMLGHLFDKVLAAHLTGTPAPLREKFLDEMTVNRSSPGSPLSRVWSGRRLSRLDVDDFMARLGTSESGAALRQSSDAALQDVAQKFEAFGAEASVYFERRARLISVLVAVAVAWFAYVNPFDLMRTYLTNPETASHIVAMRDVVLTDYETRKTEAEAAKAASAADPADPGKAADAKTAADALAAARKQVQDAAAAANAAILSLQQEGVPVGWTVARRDAAGIGIREVVGIPIPYPTWNTDFAVVFWLLTGGLLIGLGGPFWYDAVKSLTNLRDVAGGTKPDAPAEVPPENGEPVTPAEHFRVAQAGRAAGNGAAPAVRG